MQLELKFKDKNQISSRNNISQIVRISLDYIFILESENIKEHIGKQENQNEGDNSEHLKTQENQEKDQDNFKRDDHAKGNFK